MSQETASSTAQEVLSSIEKMKRKEFLPIVGSEKGALLIRTIRTFKPKRILEVGTLIGYSAILMGTALPSNAEIVTIEIHADEAKLAQRNIKRSQIFPKVKVLVGEALSIIPKLEGTFDMVFVDADKSEYYRYLKLAEGKLPRGTVIVADNAGIFADQMRDYLDYVRNSGKYKSRYHKFGNDGVEVSIKL